ncbi:hypothetical protein DCO47_23860 [Pseudomonas sp. NDM]|nr:hypothetical protein DCO47_23860 [Pseudomonas sp. NDM]
MARDLAPAGGRRTPNSGKHRFGAASQPSGSKLPRHSCIHTSCFHPRTNLLPNAPAWRKTSLSKHSPTPSINTLEIFHPRVTP